MLFVYLWIGAVLGLLTLTGSLCGSIFFNGKNLFAIINIGVTEFILFLWIFGDGSMPPEFYFWFITGYNIVSCIGMFLVKDDDNNTHYECEEEED